MVGSLDWWRELRRNFSGEFSYANEFAQDFFEHVQLQRQTPGCHRANSSW
ncbi:hypothetical protein ALP03_200106 [Pseudomonas amygdali pv. tabaci]|uniref:Uncharacterized protein n=1 Tax=Pseudomonas amygdali pv. tabaci TaxID=322 RepID=A0A3M6H0J8_PSEAJ|nr:hypothetical protein ALP03_200106 [Pseudomonas amygdali pv. tabaci]